MDERS
jgi:hypothetical protein